MKANKYNASKEKKLKLKTKETKKNNHSKDKEIGGVQGPEPTRYGDWEKKGITSDFWVLFLEIYILKW